VKNVKIELIIDNNCVSLSSYLEIKNRLAREFADANFAIVLKENQRERLRELRVNLLPVWIIDNEVQRINPFDYHSLRNRLLAKLRFDG